MDLVVAAKFVATSAEGVLLLAAPSLHPNHVKLGNGNIRLLSVLAARSAVGVSLGGEDGMQRAFTAEHQNRFARLQLLLNGARLTDPLPLLHLTPRMLFIDTAQSRAFDELRDSALLLDLQSAPDGSIIETKKSQKKNKGKKKDRPPLRQKDEHANVSGHDIDDEVKQKDEQMRGGEEPEVEVPPAPRLLVGAGLLDGAETVLKKKYDEDLLELRLHFEEKLALLHLRLICQEAKYETLQERLDRDSKTLNL